MYKQIAENKRKTIFIIIGFIIVISAIAAIFAVTYNNIWIAVWTLVAAILYAVFQYYTAASATMLMNGAKEITKKSNPRLYNIVENLSITTGLPMPRVYVVNDPAPNAFATGRDPKHAMVAATTGLMDIMNDRELTAVMAHEMSHVKNYDIRVSMIVFGLVCVIGFIADIAMRMVLYTDDDDRSPVGTVLLLVVMVFAPIIALFAQMAVSRQREYLADASAVNITRFPEGMVEALKKLQTHSRPMKRQNIAAETMYINNPLKKGFISKLLSSHPPIEKRIERLEHGKNTF